MTQSQFLNLLSKLRFADILQYVAIPKVKIELNATGPLSQRDRGGSRSARLVGDGRSDFVYVFERLRKQGVKTILKVMVDDSHTISHSDEAIEDALKGMDVEIWDWRRTDLCSEVIFNVAPKVREVSLYWSGNNAVLRGWGEEGGLKRLKELKMVHLNVQRGLESSIRTKQYVDEFCDRMKRLCPAVTIYKEGPVGRPQATSLNAQLALGDQGKHKSKHEWIQWYTIPCQV